MHIGTYADAVSAARDSARREAPAVVRFRGVEEGGPEPLVAAGECLDLLVTARLQRPAAGLHAFRSSRDLRPRSRHSAPAPRKTYAEVNLWSSSETVGVTGWNRRSSAW